MSKSPSLLNVPAMAALPALLLLVVSCDKVPEKPAKPAPDWTVTVDVNKGMTRGGKPYFVKGAGTSSRLEDLAARGGNSIRTWTTGGFETLLDEADKQGLTVSAGIWLESECNWFSYKNQAHCDKQAARVRAEILKWKDHPAILAWGLGNEAEGDGESAAFWQQIDRLAKLAKEVDPRHPTFTAVAGLSQAKAEGLNKHAPNLCYIGINTYGAAPGLRKHLAKVGWTRPWMLTEWGPKGFWESPKASFGAPLEQTSSAKAAMFRSVYQNVISNDGGCLGSYAFVWGWKFEATGTWFGLYTHEGDSTASVDVLQEMWGGGKPSNQAPSIKDVVGVPKTKVSPESAFEATVEAADPDGDPLVWRWAVFPESKGAADNGRASMPPALQGTIMNDSTPKVSVKAPGKPGIYRVHVWVRDGKGHAATANAPFEVR